MLVVAPLFMFQKLARTAGGRLMLKRVALLIAIGIVANGTAGAQTATVGTKPTVQLKISATGQSQKLADYVTIYVPISTSAETVLSARADNRAAVAKLTNALIARGVQRDAITLLPSSSRIGFIGNEAYDSSDGPVVPQAMGTMTARKSASSALRIQLANISLLDGVREVLDQQNLAMLGAPLYALKDDRAAKTAAVADAIAKAKQDADAYAAPLGLRVERVTSVSNYGDTTATTPDPNLFIQMMMMGLQEPAAGYVETRAQVWVNFELAPR